MAPPELPSPAYSDIDSLLSRKFGREVANYFSGSPLNRVSFLRPDYSFLSRAYTNESTKVLILNDQQPLTKTSSELVYVTPKELESLLGPDPYSTSEEDQLSSFNPSVRTPQLVFLGLHERAQDIKVHDRHTGSPVFALDISPLGSYKEAAESVIEGFTKNGLVFAAGRVNLALSPEDAAVYAQAKHIIDWHSRNPFCAQCGSRTLAVHGGWKRACPPTEVGDDGSKKTRPECGSRVGVSNLSFPRTDGVIIVAVVSADGTKVLLGRQARWPKLMYSTLAGFLEPGESLEEATRREVWEEAGVKLGRVVIHSTQPWPYPANIMIGAVAQATVDGETVDLGNDPELEDAKWWSIEDVRRALRVGTRGLGPSDKPSEEYKDGDLALPPRTAIANQLMEAVCNGGFLRGVTQI